MREIVACLPETIRSGSVRFELPGSGVVTGFRPTTKDFSKTTTRLFGGGRLPSALPTIRRTGTWRLSSFVRFRGTSVMLSFGVITRHHLQKTM
jgi:hypothetical protein